MDNLNLPDNIGFYRDWADISLRNCICGYNAFKVVLSSVIGMQQHIPNTCSL